MLDPSPKTLYFLIRWVNRLTITTVFLGAICLLLLMSFIPGQPGKAVFYGSLPLLLFALQWIVRSHLRRAFARYRAVNALLCIRCGYKLSDPSARCTECGDTTPEPQRQMWWQQCAHQFPSPPSTQAITPPQD